MVKNHLNLSSQVRRSPSPLDNVVKPQQPARRCRGMNLWKVILMIKLLHCVFTINTLGGIGGSRCASVRNCFHWGTPLNSHRYTSPIHWFCIGNIFCWWLWLQFQFILNPLQIPEPVVHLKNLKASPTLLACGLPQPEEWEQQRWERGQSEIDASTTSQQQQLENIQLLGKFH